MKTSKQSLLPLTLFAALSACGDDEGIPQPVPIPSESLLRGRAEDDFSKALIVGLPGAVTREGTVYLDGGRGEMQVRSTASGSFVGTVEIDAFAVVEVRFETSEAVEYAIIDFSMTPPPSPTESIMSPIEPTTPGMVTIRGEALPDADVFAVNMKTGAVSLGVADSIGLFELELAAETGEAIEVYIDFDPLGEPWQLTAP